MHSNFCVVYSGLGKKLFIGIGRLSENSKKNAEVGFSCNEPDIAQKLIDNHNRQNGQKTPMKSAPASVFITPDKKDIFCSDECDINATLLERFKKG